MKRLPPEELINKKRVFKNTNVQIIGMMVNSVIGLVTTALMARYLGSEGFGKVNIAIVYLSFTGILAGMGYQAILVREISKLKEWDEERINAILTGGLTLRFFSTFAAIAILGVYLIPSGYQTEFKWQIMLLSIVHFINTFDLFDCIFRSRLKMAYVMLASVSSRLLQLLLIWGCIQLHLGLTALIGTFIMASLLRSGMVTILSRRFIRYRFVFNRKVLRFLFRHSLVVGMAGGLWIIYYRIDTLMLEWFKGMEAVGFYNAAFRFIDYAYLLSGMLMNSIYPLMCDRFPGNPEGLRRIYQKTVDYMAIIGGAISMGIFLGAPLLIEFIFGREYLPALTTLRLFGFIPLLVFLNNAFGNMMMALGLQGKPFVGMRAAGVLINVGLNLVCIPAFGYNGAAFATVITELSLLAVVIVIIGRKILFYPSLRNFFLMFAVSLAVFAATISTINPLMVAVVSSLVFIIMAAGMCQYDRSELWATIFMKIRD